MKSYIAPIIVTDENGEKAVHYPQTKMEAVHGLEERLAYLSGSDITTTTETTLQNSHAGRLKINEIGGVMEQFLYSSEIVDGTEVLVPIYPTPSYPVDVENSVVSGIRTHSKNFLKNNHEKSTTNNGITFITNDDGTVTINGTATADTPYNIISHDIPIHDNMHFNVIQLSGSFSGNIKIRAFDAQYGNNTLGEVGEEKLLKAGIKYVVFRATIYSGTVCNNLKVGFMVAEDATEYEPYTESSITFSQPIDLYGKDGVQDVLTTKHTNRKYIKRVFDGSEAWQTSSLAGRYAISLTNSNAKPLGKCLCTQGKPGVNNTQNVNECYMSQYSAFVINTEFATLAEWKAHLQTNPMTVVYEMAEETTEELPIADQIALNSLQTFDGITYVEFISDLQPTYKAEYGTSQIGGYILESLLGKRSNELRITAVESAVINNL